MNSFVALIKREYLEHRGAFLYAPGVILGVLGLSIALGVATGRGKFERLSGFKGLGTVFEMGFAAAIGLWWAYLLIALFFYYADAFNADRRNNSMLFWKSMPQSDFKILGSKMVSGLTLFPALIFCAVLLTGIMVYLVTVLAGVVVPNSPIPNIGIFLATYSQMALAGILVYVLGLLWYAPFFAWVGMLSTFVGRWSIPLAFLIPGILMILENLLFGGSGPQGGYIWTFLSQRSQFGFDQTMFLSLIKNFGQFNLNEFVRALIMRIDWLQMAAGVIVAGLLIFIASEYRRRIIAAG
jgi:ABC-2 type transport system permease protein